MKNTTDNKTNNINIKKCKFNQKFFYLSKYFYPFILFYNFLIEFRKKTIDLIQISILHLKNHKIYKTGVHAIFWQFLIIPYIIFL